MILPTQDYRRTYFKVPDKLLEGLDGVVYGMVGWFKRRAIFEKSLKEQAEKISAAADKLRHVSDRRMRKRLQEMQDMFHRQAKGHTEIVPEALAAIVEVADRTLGLRPYPVQVMGALVLYKGLLAEMATGEGKSLTAGLTATLAGWTGRPCHIITVNDYLAGRDADEMRPFYAYCGVTTGCVVSQMPSEERRKNYTQGVVYTTSKEVTADFLRDRLLLGPYHDASRRLLRKMLLPGWQGADGLVMRGLDTAIVDEADSVLIDEAVTPLIISRPLENKPMTEVVDTARVISEALVRSIDYKTNIKYKEIVLTKAGMEKLGTLAHALPGIWKGEARRIELIKQTLTAKEFYKLDKQYVVQEGKVVIVDEFTGRLMPNRTWRQGLHQAVEAKEGLEITNPSETLSRLSFQRFFRFFRKLSGMTGTASAAAGEFWHIYGLRVVTIPTNRPCVRKVLPDQVHSNTENKRRAIVAEIERLHHSERPVLVGTRSVRDSETLGTMLESRGIAFNLLNAIRHAEEARIVADAGKHGKITIATNMAGRGTDIKLGRGVREKGGLHVIATERHESARIDRQLFGRCARQGDPGSAQAFMSVDDELIQRFVPEAMRTRLTGAVDGNLLGAAKIAKGALHMAQRAAQRMAFKQRRNVLKMDHWLEESLSFTGSSLRF